MATDPFEPRDPFDDTPPEDVGLKAWVAQYFRDKAKATEETT